MRIAPALLAAALLLHVAFCLLRVPHDVVGKRLTEVAEWRSEGDAAYLFRTAQLQEGAEVIDRLRAELPPDGFVAFRGDRKGAGEFAPALLWPRLCVDASLLPPGAVTWNGRRTIDAVLLAAGGRLVLVER